MLLSHKCILNSFSFLSCKEDILCKNISREFLYKQHFSIYTPCKTIKKPSISELGFLSHGFFHYLFSMEKINFGAQVCDLYEPYKII